jgi:hypothetical protein
MPRALALAALALASCSATDDAEPPRERASLDPARSSAPPTPAPAPPTPAAGASAPSAPPAEPTPSASASAPAALPSAPTPPLRADLVSACERRPELPCTRDGDLDGDGQRDTVALVRPKDGVEIGLLISWGRGGTALLGAGEAGQTWREQVDESARTVAIPTDLDWLARWDVWPADGPADRRHGFRPPNKRRSYRAPAVRGDGLLVDGGDSAAVAYWDGARWRLHYLGF